MGKPKYEPVLQLVTPHEPRSRTERRRQIQTCAFLATTLDKQMLLTRAVQIAAEDVPDHALPLKPGADVAEELGGRFLLRYVLPKDFGRNQHGMAVKTYTTVTAYRPADAVPYLNLPPSTFERSHVLLLDPAKIEQIRGPRIVLHGKGGLEYILPDGYPAEAVSGGWELQIS